MADIILRSVKGSPLSIAEADANFSNLNTEVGTKLTATEYTAADVLTKIKTVDGTGSGLDADLLDGLNTSNSHVIDTATIVTRNTSGNFSANTITANLVGGVTGNVLGNLTGTVTGNATNVDGVVAVNNGGTGATTVTAARTALGLGTLATQNSSAVTITGGTITGITDLALVDGGTGASTATQARTNLGLVIGTDVQPFSNELTGIASAVNATGFYVRLGTGSVTERIFTVGGNGLSITNGDGIAGNPQISIATNSTMQLDALTVRTLTVSGTSNTLTVAGATALNGGLTMDTNKFVVADTTGNTTIGGTLGVSGVTTLAAVSTGAITTTGAITATGNITGFFSDDRLKTKLGRIENALEKLCSLEGFYFEPNQTAQDLGYAKERQVGVSAQQVQAVLPEVIHPAPIDAQYLTVDYSRIVPLIVEAIKEIREELNRLNNK
jgi:trimeric autotransporter adhesin